MLIIKSLTTRRKVKVRPGSALILTMFIMAGMLIVALSGVYVILLGIKASGVQLQSAKAYYAAEAGAERVLYELYKNNCAYSAPPCTTNIDLVNPIFSNTLSAGMDYKVYYTNLVPIVFQSIGNYQNTKRSVEIRIGGQ